MYWIYNKKTGNAGICGSVIAISEFTGISKYTLYYHFSRLKKKNEIIHGWEIRKQKITRAKSDLK